MGFFARVRSIFASSKRESPSESEPITRVVAEIVSITQSRLDYVDDTGIRLSIDLTSCQNSIQQCVAFRDSSILRFEFTCKPKVILQLKSEEEFWQVQRGLGKNGWDTIDLT